VTVVFDQHLAQRFEAVLRSVSATITDSWAPGLTDEQIDAATVPLDLDLPEEARAWWRWHNGVGPDIRGPHWDLVPNRPLFHLEMALEGYADERAYMLEQEGADQRLMAVGDRPYIYFDCSGDRRAPVPIYSGDHGYAQRLVLPSIGELVQIWIDLIEQGIWTTAADGTWLHPNFEQLPPHVQQLGVY
jgi:hypothetical protein